jgi:NAD(P)-dependent dehydrogenase (short-subunit alcohol dehydrogenase family)
VCINTNGLSLGAARGIGLALATVSAELGSDVAVIDTLEQPSPDFERLNEFGVKVKYYR